MKDKTKVKLGIKTKLSKYSKGKDPKKDKPDEVIRGFKELKGKEAREFMKKRK